MATIKGTNSGETKTGTTAADLIYGYGGNDSLYGRAGDDQIWGGLGDDKIWGEAGADILRGEDGNDVFYSGDGNDKVYGGVGNDTLYGDAGTDTIYGDAGNDILKGGSGISKLYGGDGNDQLFYDPTTGNIASIGQYLAGSVLEGNGGTDTLNVFNKSTYTDGTTSKPTLTAIWVDENDIGHIRFMDPASVQTGKLMSDAGTFNGIEKITVNGSGGASITNHGKYDKYGPGITAVGTSGNDRFQSVYESDIFTGGAGNDQFRVGGGNDVVFSEPNDSDTFYFESWSVYTHGKTTITGFNGAGVSGGDIIHLGDISGGGYQDVKISESNGKTSFTVDSWSGAGSDTWTVDAVGLKQDVDYFFV